MKLPYKTLITGNFICSFVFLLVFFIGNKIWTNTFPFAESFYTTLFLFLPGVYLFFYSLVKKDFNNQKWYKLFIFYLFIFIGSVLLLAILSFILYLIRLL